MWESSPLLAPPLILAQQGNSQAYEQGKKVGEATNVVIFVLFIAIVLYYGIRAVVRKKPKR